MGLKKVCFFGGGAGGYVFSWEGGGILLFWKGCHVGDFSHAHDIDDSEGVSYSAQGVSHSAAGASRLMHISSGEPHRKGLVILISIFGKKLGSETGAPPHGILPNQWPQRRAVRRRRPKNPSRTRQLGPKSQKRARHPISE